MNVARLTPAAFQGSQNYVPPPKDKTPTEIRITRKCYAQQRDGLPAERVEIGTVLTVPKWVANDLHEFGKADLL